MAQKQYGLIRLSKDAPKGTATTGLAKKPSIFGDSDEDSDSDSATIPQVYASNTRRQAQALVSQAEAEDPTINQYDEVYDDMKKKTASNKNENAKHVKKNPQYIERMLKQKEDREKEQELREERKIHRERELEGEEFKDKESFVTSAYKEKLEEMKKSREESARQDNIEALLDVTKQSDLNGFYRSMFRNNLFDEPKAASDQSENNPSVKFNKKQIIQKKGNLRERNIASDDESDDNNDTEQNIVEDLPLVKEPERTTSEGSASNNNNKPLSTEGPKRPLTEPETKEVKSDTEKAETSKSSPGKENESETKVPSPKKPKLDRAELIRRMFTKRTVNEALEAARARYFERKALRQL